jgi:hypothetical protein
MADNTILPARRYSALALRIPFRIAAPLAAMFALLHLAANMAYVAPYASLHRLRPGAPDEELKGRDPDW